MHRWYLNTYFPFPFSPVHLLIAYRRKFGRQESKKCDSHGKNSHEFKDTYRKCVHSCTSHANNETIIASMFQKINFRKCLTQGPVGWRHWAPGAVGSKNTRDLHVRVTSSQRPRMGTALLTPIIAIIFVYLYRRVNNI